MKNISLILNIVLLIAVGILYFKVFSGPKAPDAKADTTTETVADKPLKIVYINADTLLEKYDAFKLQREALQKKEKDADASLKAKGRALEQDFLAAQKKVQTGTMAPSDVQKEEQRLMQKQQALQQEQERVTQALLADTKKVNDELQKALIDKLKGFKEREGYDFIFSYAAGGQILVSNDSLDITQKVLEELNAKKENQ
jgi:outer membrane protein